MSQEHFCPESASYFTPQLINWGSFMVAHGYDVNNYYCFLQSCPLSTNTNTEFPPYTFRIYKNASWSDQAKMKAIPLTLFIFVLWLQKRKSWGNFININKVFNVYVVTAGMRFLTIFFLKNRVDPLQSDHFVSTTLRLLDFQT